MVQYSLINSELMVDDGEVMMVSQWLINGAWLINFSVLNHGQTIGK